MRNRSLSLGISLLFVLEAPPYALGEEVPHDPVELATGPIQVASSPATRDPFLQLLTRVKQNFALRRARQAYDLKVRFIVNSGGETNYDGAWEMEDKFAPGLGLRWTARAASGYATTGLFAQGKIYSEGNSATSIPLRLHEARALLLDPVQSASFAKLGSVRSVSATYQDTPLVCILLSAGRSKTNSIPRRDWDEAQECIDPQTGLLHVHSDVPGRYVFYDYANGVQLSGHILPSKVTVVEAGRIVSNISVESIDASTAFDSALFVPSDAMTTGGQATAMTSSTKIIRINAGIDGRSAVSPSTSGTTTIRPVCVFGMVTAKGQLVEAHSLQPTDPNSQAAVEDAKRIDFSPTMAPGAAAHQHLVFIIEKFVVPVNGM